MHLAQQPRDHPEHRAGRDMVDLRASNDDSSEHLLANHQECPRLVRVELKQIRSSDS